MADLELDDKNEEDAFQKKEHRPWKTALLETTILEAASLDDDFDTDLDFTLDLDTSEFNFIDDDNIVTEPDAFEDDLLDLAMDYKAPLNAQQKLSSKIHPRSTHQILLGGFFHPQGLHSPASTTGSKRINSMVSDLRVKENRLSSLTRDLERTENKERIMRAEINRKAATKSRIAAESKMHNAIEQAHILSDQFRVAMDQANHASLAYREEERLRIQAQEETKEAKVRANNAELALQNERMARNSMEEKVQEALRKSEQHNLIQQQLEQVTEKLHKIELALVSEENLRLDAQRQYAEANTKLNKIEAEHQQCADKFYTVDNIKSDLQLQITQIQKQLEEATAQRDKLKEIVHTEQKLRRIAEQAMQEALNKAEQAEKERAQAVTQCKVIDERARRAVEHASKTVMHILNAPENNEFSLTVMSKAKAELDTAAPVEPLKEQSQQEEYSFTEDDYTF